METLHVRPEAREIDTRSELLKFYDEHYSANIMHLVVYGKGRFLTQSVRISPFFLIFLLLIVIIMFSDISNQGLAGWFVIAFKI